GIARHLYHRRLDGAERPLLWSVAKEAGELSRREACLLAPFRDTRELLLSGGGDGGGDFGRLRACFGEEPEREGEKAGDEGEDDEKARYEREALHQLSFGSWASCRMPSAAASTSRSVVFQPRERRNAPVS